MIITIGKFNNIKTMLIFVKDYIWSYDGYNQNFIKEFYDKYLIRFKCKDENELSDFHSRLSKKPPLRVYPIRKSISVDSDLIGYYFDCDSYAGNLKDWNEFLNYIRHYKYKLKGKDILIGLEPSKTLDIRIKNVKFMKALKE